MIRVGAHISVQDSLSTAIEEAAFWRSGPQSVAIWTQW